MNRNGRRWAAHAVFVAILALQLLTWAVLHRSDDEVRRVWEHGTTAERLPAFRVLTNRGTLDPAEFDSDFVRGLLADPDVRIRELAFTNEICKFNPPPEVQTPYVFTFEGKETGHAWRSFVLHRRKVGGTIFVGGGLRMRLRELEWFLDATHDSPPNEAEIREHLKRIAERVANRVSEGRPPYR